jgi:EpsI family protein
VSGRAALVIAILVATQLFPRQSGPDRAASRIPLSALPMQLAAWAGRDAGAFEDDVVAAAGVDEYVNRIYSAPKQTPVALYVGYYASQRQGDRIHSPQNCLPGAGWQPLASSTLRVGTSDGASVPVNQVVIQKALDRQLVLYWYAGRGRTIANEYANRWWLMLDAARLHRTDGGLVRIVAPVIGDPSRAAHDAAAFAAVLLPELPRYLP